MKGMVQYVSDPFVDAGVAVLECKLEKPCAKFTKDDLKDEAKKLESMYGSKIWRGYLTVHFPNSGWCNATIGEEKRKEFLESSLRGYRREPLTPRRGCSYCGRPAQLMADRSSIPLLTGKTIMVAGAGGAPGLPVCGHCLLAIQFYPLCTLKVEGKPLFWTTPDPQWTFRLTRRFLTVVEKVLALNHEQFTSLRWPSTQLLRYASEVVEEWAAEPKDKRPPLCDLVGCQATNYGSGPDYAELRIPSGLLEFWANAGSFGSLYREIVQEAWEADRAGKGGKTRKKGSREGDEKVGLGDLGRRNLLYEDLGGAFRAPDFREGAKGVARRYFLAGARDQVRRGRFDLTVYFLEKVAGMEKTRLEAIREIADAVAESKARSQILDRLMRSGRSLYDFAPVMRYVQWKLAGDLARLQTAPVCVCSPFQLIRLLFAPRGVEGLLAGLWQARLIWDEIHAYDVEVTALTLAAARFLTKQLEARMLLMTATLPSHLRTAIRACVGEIGEIPVGEDVWGLRARHRMRLLPFDALGSEAEALIQRRAARGSVLVVVNQVERARCLHGSLRAKGGNVRLLHGRFSYADRAAREKELRPEAGRILVATQAVEVSLDIDYDSCLSELAPLESLLQRFGRCNRRGEQSEAAEVGVFASFPAGGRRPELPYEREHLEAVLGALRSFLEEQQDREIVEREVGELIDRSYPKRLREQLSQTVGRRVEEVQSNLIDTFEPFGMGDWESVRRLAEEWEKLFDGEEVLTESLVERARSEASWLGRTRYFVPISRRQMAKLHREGMLRRDEDLGCLVANVPYNPETGLDLQGTR